MEQEIRDDYRTVAGWLLYYHERRAAYEQRREEILQSSTASEYCQAPARAGISDATGKRGVKLADLEETGEWLTLVTEIEKGLPPKLCLLLRLRREALYAKTRLRGRPAWVSYAQGKYANEIAKRTGRQLSDCWVEDRTLFSWWDKIVTYATIKASKRGLL